MVTISASVRSIRRSVIVAVPSIPCYFGDSGPRDQFGISFLPSRVS
jgi:hypothetical protein